MGEVCVGFESSTVQRDSNKRVHLPGNVQNLQAKNKEKACFEV